MGWDVPTQKVIRTNSRFTGTTVWDADLQSLQPVDAYGHDIHDQDLADSISETLNINGVNSMAANLDMGGTYKVIGLGAGTAATDSVTKGQMDAADTTLQGQIDSNDTELADHEGRITANTGRSTQNETDIGTLQGQVTGLDSGIITAIAWNANILSHTRPGGDFDITIESFDTFKSNGDIRHLSGQWSGPALFDISSQTRFYYNNDGSNTLTFQRPSGDDPDLGPDYCIEGSVLITNVSGAGTLTLNNDAGAIPAANILGIQNTNVGAVMVLSYLIHRLDGNSYKEVYSWCT